jgi:hypothetical protein
MWSFVIVASAPGLDDDPSFGSGPEPFEVQALVPELPVEAFVRSVLPVTCLPFLGPAES